MWFPARLNFEYVSDKHIKLQYNRLNKMHFYALVCCFSVSLLLERIKARIVEDGIWTDSDIDNDEFQVINGVVTFKSSQDQ